MNHSSSDLFNNLFRALTVSFGLIYSYHALFQKALNFLITREEKVKVMVIWWVTNGKQKLEKSEEARNETGTQSTVLRTTGTGFLACRTQSHAVRAPYDTHKAVAELNHDSHRPWDQRGLFLVSWCEEKTGEHKDQCPQAACFLHIQHKSQGLFPVPPSVLAQVPMQKSSSQEGAWQHSLA